MSGGAFDRLQLVRFGQPPKPIPPPPPPPKPIPIEKPKQEKRKPTKRKPPVEEFYNIYRQL